MTILSPSAIRDHIYFAYQFLQQLGSCVQGHQIFRVQLSKFESLSNMTALIVDVV
jgi:hypothetical protein